MMGQDMSCIEVVQERPPFNKGCLERVDQVVEDSLQSGGQHLGDDLSKTVDQADRPVIPAPPRGLTSWG